ncbi:MAG: hypothetical protein GZ093_12685 [Rhodoferax sp.]|uniref:hypothetical protein n=1 Tax=Rhodoferax sp. TaxID=50421 RepID=UPI001400F9EB|nr:hypothetical protein [Rhodoferax sp.]NDP39587.1 hypothetical protein [Rhodoferax sp.]
MLPAHLEKALTDVELHVNEVSAALVSGEPLALTSASAALRQVAIDFSALLQRLTSFDIRHKDLKPRLTQISNGMLLQRESLLRRTALVEMALNTVMPTDPKATYAQTGGPYASVGRQTGAFKYLAA